MIKFNPDTMTTMVYPLPISVKELWTTTGTLHYSEEWLTEHNVWNLTQVAVDYLHFRSVDTFMAVAPVVLIAGKPCCARPQKLRSRTPEELGEEIAAVIQVRKEEGLSMGFMGFGQEQLAEPYSHKFGYMGRFFLSRTPMDEILRLAELTRMEGLIV